MTLKKTLLLFLLCTLVITPVLAQEDNVIEGFIDDETPYIEIPLTIAESGVTIIVDIIPTIGDLDTLLYLVDEKGSIVAENDDRAKDDTSSLLEFPQAEAGRYTIIATRYKVAEGSSSGAFAMEITIDEGTVETAAEYVISDNDLLAVGFPEIEAQEEAEWTILVYYGADNNLEPGILYDLDEFEVAGGSDDQVRIIALVDRSPEFTDVDGDWTSARIYEIGNSDSGDHETAYPPTLDSEYLADLGEVESDSGQMLTQFLVWGIRQYPARHYAVAFGSHGAGWQGLITDDSSEAEVGYPILSVPELQQSFGIALNEAGTEQFDLLINDACLMSSVEYYAALEPYFHYSLASPEIVVNPALDMSMFIRLLGESEEQVDFNSIGTQLVTQYIDTDILKRASSDTVYLTHALTDLDNFDPVVQEVENFARIINTNPGINAIMIGNARSNAYTYTAFMGGDTKIDLGSFMKQVKFLSNDTVVIRSAERVLVALDNAKIYGDAGERAEPRVSYYNIYFPDSSRDFQISYFEESPMQEWGKMLRNYYNVVTPQVWNVGGIGFHLPKAPSVNFARFFPEEGNASIFRPLSVRVEVSGSSIAYGDITIDQIQEDGTILRMTTERMLTSVVVDGESVLNNYWPAGVSVKNFGWDVALARVTDGNVSNFEPTTVTESTVFINGRYREAGGESWHDVAVTFDRETQEFQRVINRSTGSDALAVIDIAAGSDFQMYNSVVTPDGAVTLEPGNQYIWPEGGLTWSWEAAPSGGYNFGMLVTAHGGTTGFESVSLTVDNDDVSADEVDFRSETDTGIGLIIPRGEDWAWFTWFRNFGFHRTISEDKSENITIYWVFANNLDEDQQATFGTDLEETQNMIFNTMLTKYERVLVGEPVATTLSDYPVLRFEYGYEVDGDMFSGVGYAYYHEARNRGMIISAEAIDGIGDLDKMDALVNSRLTIFEPTVLSNNSLWYNDGLDHAEYVMPSSWGYFENGIWYTYSPGGDTESPTFISLNDVTAYATTADTNDLLASLTSELVLGVMDEFEITGNFTYNGTNHSWKAVLFKGIRDDEPIIGRFYGIVVGANVYAVWMETLDNEEAPAIFTGIFEPVIARFEIEEIEAEGDSVVAITEIDAESTDEAAVLLRYNRQSMVLYNRWPGEETIDISGLTFVFTPPEGEEVEFDAIEWELGDLNRMRPGDCYQLWMPRYSDIEASVPPADICVWRQGYITTLRPFWLSDEAATEFEIKLHGETIAVCPTVANIPDDEFFAGDVDFGDEMRCLVDVARPLPPVDATSTEDAEMLLRYDRRSLVLYNRWPLSEEEGVTNNIDISRITFAQTQEDGGAVEFSATEWTFGDLQNLAPGDCYQLWMPFYSDIAAGVAPADICTSRKGLFTTRRPFWLSDSPGATFSVLLDGEQLLTCPTALNISEEEFAGGDVSFGADMRCIVDLP